MLSVPNASTLMSFPWIQVYPLPLNTSQDHLCSVPRFQEILNPEHTLSKSYSFLLIFFSFFFFWGGKYCDHLIPDIVNLKTMRVSTRPKSVISWRPREKASIQRLKGKDISNKSNDGEDEDVYMLSRTNLLRQGEVSWVIRSWHDI